MQSSPRYDAKEYYATILSFADQRHVLFRGKAKWVLERALRYPTENSQSTATSAVRTALSDTVSSRFIIQRTQRQNTKSNSRAGD